MVRWEPGARERLERAALELFTQDGYERTTVQERELLKLASLTAALSQALRERGVSEQAATLAAETAMAVFKTAFAQWASGTGDLSEIIKNTLAELKAVISVA